VLDDTREKVAFINTPTAESIIGGNIVQKQRKTVLDDPNGITDSVKNRNPPRGFLR
jgi:hypothetical protein